MEAETGVMCPEAKGCRQPPGAGTGAWKRFSLRRVRPCPPLDLGLQAS